MNYIEQIKGFWLAHEVEEFPINAIALYFYLLEVNNKASWISSFKRNNSKICADLGITKPTLNTCRNRLKQAGLLDFETKNGSANVTYTFKKFLQVNKEVGTKVTNEVSSRLVCTKDKLKLKQFLLEKETKEREGKFPDDILLKNPLKPPEETSKRKKVAPKKEKVSFSPPSLQEVQEYCDERQNGISAESFVNFYQSKNWMVGKNKMTDWKAAIRTWEQKRKDQTNGKSNTEYSRFSPPKGRRVAQCDPEKMAELLARDAETGNLL